MAPQRRAGAGAEAELPEYAGHYRLESLLGSGGMGMVHLARSTSGLKLAVKVVHAEFARDREFRGRFRQEVAAARRVSGAFTAPVVDADPEAERPWMATLFIPGPTLAEQVKRNGPMTPAQLRRLMAGLAEALRDIHRVGVVHRDLKPSNVLLAEDGPKVIDFGISRPSDSELRTETGKLIGTPPFMAPEQFRRPREVGPAADVFALGSVVVHAATGRGPFDSDSPYVVAYQVVHDEPDLTGIPQELAPLVLRCLAKEPEDRPTPDELMRELRSVAASYDTQAFIPAQRTGAEAAPPPSPRQPRRPPRKRLTRGALVAGAALVLAASGAASVHLAGPDGDPPAKTPAPAPSAAFGAWEAKPASGEGGMPHCSRGTDELLCARRDAVFALDPTDGGLRWRHTTSDRTVSRPPVVSGGTVQTSTAEDGLVEGLDPASGTPVWRRDVPEGGAVRYAGDTLLLTGADGTVTGVDGSSGATKWNRSLPGHGGTPLASFAADPLAYATSTSPDGTHTRLTAVDPDTGALRWDVRLEGALQAVGAGGGSVFLLSGDPRDGTTTGLVRYSPRSGTSLRVPLPVPRHDVRATVRGNVVHLLAQGGSLEAVDLEARKRVWHLETGISHGSAPVSDGRHVYVTAPDGRLLAVDARSGRLLGQTAPRLGAAADRVVASLPEPVVAEGRVYASAPDGTVFAVDGREPADW
ncbi:serine/threonine-protein kinase [Streptomyces prasinopilosus]|uniref:Serine/threonine protein kinase n=1 Tax=Streptomyces prasinopilosus TaxID=67344 RepID=A0A1G6W2Y0_9ACTN|nr:serine/threonine-protein kinase [Streptomyces prasinopilosus]SDD60169.1 Serine/threonine protein kinase [Streptomyces prasinopilosus]